GRARTRDSAWAPMRHHVRGRPRPSGLAEELLEQPLVRPGRRLRTLVAQGRELGQRLLMARLQLGHLPEHADRAVPQAAALVAGAEDEVGLDVLRVLLHDRL